MSDPEVVVRLLAAIDERERKAREAGGQVWKVDHCGRVNDDGEIVDCEPGCYCCRIEGDDITIYDEGGHDPCQAEHIVLHSPDRVLRLCQSHRDIVAEWQKQAQFGRQIAAEEPYSDTHFTSDGVVAGLWAAVVLVARGYGIEDGEAK